jgi:hypothetical protein
MFQVARNYVHFFQHESCGFCTPCRVGTSLLKNLMDKLHNGCGSPYDFTEIEKLNQLLQSMSHCGLGHTACNPVLDTIAKFRPYYDKRMMQQDFTPAFDLDRALAAARQMTGRDDAAAHLRPNTEVQHEPDLYARRQDHPLRGADHHPGGQRGRRLHPAPVLPPGIQAARLVQAVHGQGEWPADRLVHHARLARHGGRKRNRGNQRRTPGADPDAVRRGQPFLPVVRKKWQLPAAGHGLPPRHDEPALRPLLPDRPVDASHPEVLLDFNRCILCSLCVRASRDVDGKNVFALSGRGIKTHLIVNAKSGQLGDTDFTLDDKAAQVLPGGVILKKRRALPCRSASAPTTRRRLPTP